MTTGEALLMAHRAHHGETEAEPVLVTVEAGTVTLELDDGQTLALDLRELLRAAGIEWIGRAAA